MSRHDVLPPTIINVAAYGNKHTFRWVCKRCFSSVEEAWVIVGGKLPPPSYIPMNLFNTHADCDSLMVERMLKI
jgi:hypothetical protein